MSLEERIAEAALIMAGNRNGAALTGAGISVESGIPDFRSQGGLWTRYPPHEYATIDAFTKNPAKVWKMLAEMEKVLDAASPNPAHEALAELERLGVLGGIITQNIDGLHQAAGSSNVIEFHGSHATLTCPGCGARHSREEAKKLPVPPHCGCGEILKPDVIFFGEMIPPRAHERAGHLASSCGYMLVVGTSAEVAPASHMPLIAARNRVKVIEINVEPSMLTRTVTDVFIRERAGVALPILLEAVKRRLAS